MRGSARSDVYFVDVTAAAGIPTEPTRSWGSTWADFVGDDNAPDLFVNRHARIPLLLANDGDGGYRTIDEDLYPSYFDRHGCAWGEANADGELDYYCVQGADEGSGRGANQLWIAAETGFVDRASEFGVADPFGRGRTVNWLDHDGDLDLDVFVGNKRRAGRPNLFFENRGGSFMRVDVGLEQELLTVNSTWADWDVDGDPDLLVLQYPPRRVVAYENDGGVFRSVTVPGITDTGSWTSAAWADADGDGRPDVALLRETRLVVLANTERGFRARYRADLDFGRMSAWLDVDNDTYLDLFVVQGAPKDAGGAGRNRPDFLVLQRGGDFEMLANPSVAGPTSGYGDAVSVADHDRDGRQDLFVTNGFGPRPASGPSVLLENRSRGGRSAGLDLEGDDRNPLGFGAAVRVSLRGRTYHRQVTDGFNFRSQNEVGHVHLGLGESPEARVSVSWPNGVRDCITLTAGSIRPLSMGAAPCG